MAVFKFVISEGKKTYQIEKDQRDCPVIGKKIGDAIGGDFLGMAGYEFKVTGGSDKDGFPMRSDIEGVMRKKIILTKGTGFKGKIKAGKKIAKPKKGARKRKILRGNTITLDVVQINCKVMKSGEKTIEEILGTAKKTEPEKEA